MNEVSAVSDSATRAARTSLAAMVAAYCALIVAGELVEAISGALPAAVLDAVVLVVIANHYVLGSRFKEMTRLLPALSLVPLLRLSSLTLAVRPPIEFFALAGSPVLLATLMLRGRLRLRVRLGDIRLRSQWWLALAAVPIGAGATLVFHPHPLLHRWPVALAGSLVVFVFAGVLEELLFRGVLQRALGFLGGAGVGIANLLFASTYLATGSAAAVILAALGGGMAGWWVRRTNSLAGVMVAHGIIAAGYLVIWPLVL